MDLSIIVPVYNSDKTIRDCLLSILNSDFNKDFEVIVVNDGSTDKSIENIKDLDVQIINQENRGAAAARNRGARQAKSELLIFVDADVTFFKDTLTRIYDHLKKDDIDYVSIRYSKRPLNKKWIHKYKALADYFYYYNFIFTKRQKQRPIKQVTLNGGVEGYKKRVFKELGGFDEKIKGADIEREKLISKLTKNYRVVADGNIRTKHNFPDFRKLVKIYFMRTFHSMEMVIRSGYTEPDLKRNVFRIGLGGLTVISLIFSLSLFLIFDYTLLFILTLILFSGYLSLHIKMFIITFKEYGFLFMLYTLVINLFFCFLISLAGFLGASKNLLLSR